MKRTLSLILALALALTCALSLASCGEKTNDKKIVVGASSTPHAEILEIAKDILAKKGYELEIKVYNDYVLPNTATQEGELDANYFQHGPYLENFNKENNTTLVSIAAVHYEPYGIYAGTAKSLAELKDGDTIIVTNDATNEARALQLLAAQGLFTLKEDAGLTATAKDIVDNPHNYQIREMEAALITNYLDECALAVINGNYALAANLDFSKALAIEDKNSEAAQTFANVLVVKEGNETNEALLALKEALLSEEVKTYIESTYGGAVIPIF